MKMYFMAFMHHDSLLSLGNDTHHILYDIINLVNVRGYPLK